MTSLLWALWLVPANGAAYVAAYFPSYKECYLVAKEIPVGQVNVLYACIEGQYVR